MMVNEGPDDDYFLSANFFNYLVNFNPQTSWPQDANLLVKKRIFIPINENGNHWFLVVIHMIDKNIVVYDSFQSKVSRCVNLFVNECLQRISDWLSTEANKTESPIDMNTWSVSHCHWCPKQENGNDCGLFVLANMLLLRRNFPLVYNQEHVTKFRAKVLKCLSRAPTK